MMSGFFYGDNKARFQLKNVKSLETKNKLTSADGICERL